MKKLAFLLALAVAGYMVWSRAQPTPARLTKALDEAKAGNKLVLLDFTGSDWCGWCKKLEEESLGKPEFINYAAKNLITLIVDFPMQHELPADLKSANKALKAKYDVQGFPTLIALSPAGKVVWTQVGYAPLGPSGLITPLNQARKALGLPEPSGEPASPLAVATPKPAPAKVAESTQPAATAPLASHGLPDDAPKLRAVLYSRSNPSIILGGIRCVEGDSVGRMKVIKILPDKVMVEWDGQPEELTMH